MRVKCNKAVQYGKVKKISPHASPTMRPRGTARRDERGGDRQRHDHERHPVFLKHTDGTPLAGAGSTATRTARTAPPPRAPPPAPTGHRHGTAPRTGWPPDRHPHVREPTKTEDGPASRRMPCERYGASAITSTASHPWRSFSCAGGGAAAYVLCVNQNKGVGGVACRDLGPN